MEKSQIEEFIKISNRLKVQVMEREPLKFHTTFKIGGPARVFVKLKTLQELVEVFRFISENEFECKVIGNGSNIVVSDDGIDKIVLNTSADPGTGLELLDDTTIRAYAGVSLSSICKFAWKAGLSGFEFAFGIPARLGGAIYMNASAYGGQMSDVLQKISYMDEKANTHQILAENAGFGYRKSIFMEQKTCILEATIKLNKGKEEEIKAKMLKFMELRKSKQPWELPSAGSVFKRLEGYFSGELIEGCNLKGVCVGEAEVSTKHAGFIVNKGNASFKDVASLVQKIQDEVFEKKGVKLECEIEFVN